MDTKVSALSNPAFNRAQRLLNRWVNEKALSESGRDWLIAALDPFHDTELKSHQGWPDVETGKSVIRKIPQTISVASPGTGEFTGNWDLVILQWPTLELESYGQSSTRWGNNLGSQVGNSQIGGLQAYAVKPGTTFTPFLQLTSTTTKLLATIEVDDEYTTGLGRLIGLGFETHNTTAEINLQGAVSVAVMNQCGKDSDTYFYTDQTVPSAPVYSVFSGSRMAPPPGSLADLMLLPGSMTWKAKEGTYQVVHFHSNQNGPFQEDYNVPVFGSPDSTVDGDLAVFFPSITGVGNIVPSAGTVPASHIHPIHTSITWYSGLSLASTIQINQLAYYETFPTQQQKDILVLATPSAEYDPVALEIYSHALTMMPPGVRVAENNIGDWFASVIETVSNVASWIPHPIASVVSKAGGLVAPMIRGAPIEGVPRRAKQKKPKKKKPQSPSPPPLPPRPRAGTARPLPPLPRKR